MASTLKKIIILFSSKERNQLFLLFLMIIIMGMLDTLGVASIMPFLSILGNPDAIFSNQILEIVYGILGFSDNQSFLVFLGAFVFAMLIISNSFTVVTTWFMLRFIHLREFSISRRLLNHYLQNDYSFFLNRNTSDLNKNILSETGLVIMGFLIPSMSALSKGVSALFILVFLVYVDPLIACAVFTVFSGSYFFIYGLFRKKLTRIGEGRLKANQGKFKIVNEAFGGIKEIKLHSFEDNYIKRYSTPAKAYAGYQASSQIISQLPKYVLESIAFGGLLLVVLMLLVSKHALVDAIPIIGLYAFAGYRLLPAMQQIFVGVSKARYSLAALDNLYADLSDASHNTSVSLHEPKSRRPLFPKKTLVLKNITFQYKKDTKPVIKNINLEIKKGMTVGLVGGTGAGKTTIVDLVMGLLVPVSGQILVDGEPITPMNIKNWQKCIGYVPQHIFLSDDTISQNIAFGVPPEEIDMDRVKEAAALARLNRFVEDELPDQYDTVVGERGVRLSGGQIQRIGIARAFYFDPPFLVLDEATSALDNSTEDDVLKSVYCLSGKRTVLMIAHRLSTIKNCDLVVLLKDGEIVDKGTFSQVIEKNKNLKQILQKGGR